MKFHIAAVALALSALPVGAQTAGSPAKSIGMFAYPKNQQSADQQLKDETDCYASAQHNTGIGDPNAPPPAAPQQQAAAPDAGKGRTVAGSAKGAAGGAAIGAVAGDAGKGAAIGATVGAAGGRRQQKKAEAAAKQQAAQQQQQAQAQTQAQQQNNLETFKKAFSACMDARGYSIK